MSVIMTFWVMGDPDKVEQVAGENKEKMRAIAERAVEYGLIAHRIYGSERQIMVVDEWPDEAAFHRFYGDMQTEIEQIMGKAGIQSQPQIRFWRKLETHDEVGWDA